MKEQKQYVKAPHFTTALCLALTISLILHDNCLTESITHSRLYLQFLKMRSELQLQMHSWSQQELLCGTLIANLFSQQQPELSFPVTYDLITSMLF
jgi:hypothetical protein